ncbi:uncharacterized protein [Amphiura filiformis]|uniref:uncharacterized protein isoform X2 n=1 Tax=Amphiura filiformis TaxID=82378 RepID=UPI003B20C675
MGGLLRSIILGFLLSSSQYWLQAAGQGGDDPPGTASDEDECSSNTDNCHTNATCTNTVGSFTCACNTGYIGDGINCNDNYVCESRTFHLECPAGQRIFVSYALYGRQASDVCTDGPIRTVNCAADNSLDVVQRCEGLTKCDIHAHNDVFGDPCRGTFKYLEIEYLCEDINECTNSEHNCHVDATCTNTIGSFSCACNNGYSGDGAACIDTNECINGEHNCHNDATCTNTNGSFSCACNDGYSGDGAVCDDINECTGEHNCHDDATCTNTIGSFSCACNNGYRGDGTACVDIDECTNGEDNCHSDATCTNTIGSFSCACNSGYNGDGTTCVVTGSTLECKNGRIVNGVCICKRGFAGDDCSVEDGSVVTRGKLRATTDSSIIFWDWKKEHNALISGFTIKYKIVGSDDWMNTITVNPDERNVTIIELTPKSFYNFTVQNNGRCEGGYDACSRGSRCMEDRYFCDGFIDCEDTRRDEIFCPCIQDDFFRCDNFRCIAPERECDGEDHCGDNSDETKCQTTPVGTTIEPDPCEGTGMFACSSKGPCIEEILVCDDFPDCNVTNTDEFDCSCVKEGYFRCSNLRCIPPNLICNGEDECGDKSDEMNCPTTPEATTEQFTTLSSTTDFSTTTDLGPCDTGYFACSDEGPCIDGILECDSLIDCNITRKDEIGCSCKNETYFRCDNIRCIAPDLICNEVDDCGDNSDERNCGCFDGYFACPYNGTCIEDIKRCDAIIDCTESLEDEMYCDCPNRTDFRCSNTRCISRDLICNGEDECEDNSDETNCSTTKPSTTSGSMTTDQGLCDGDQFICSDDGQCMDNIFICDEFIDCKETNEDEIYCSCKNETYFRCDNVRCIAPDLICNEVDDCGDKSDERNCSCKNETYYRCDNVRCIAPDLICNEVDDCGDNSDERNCPCDADQFACSNEGPCISEELVCDSFIDCVDTKEDEKGCPCLKEEEGYFRCANLRCISPESVCNGIGDCDDMSDEMQCPTTPVATTTKSPSTISPTTYSSNTTTSPTCLTGYFACSPEGACIERRKVCDSIIDCKNTMADEINCTCPRNGDWRCANTRCIPPNLICNGENNCEDYSDEENCPTPAATTESPTTTEQVFTTDSSTTIELMTTEQDPCQTDEFACSIEGPCIKKKYVCDAYSDCPLTHKDERNCPCPKEEHVRCDNARCIHSNLICDGNDNCGDNSDETHCPTTMVTTESPMTTESDQCQDGYFACSDDGPCFNNRLMCDEYVDCTETKMDEINCPCPREGDVRCANTRCVALDKICNGEDDCRDNSDETDCPTTMPVIESSTTTASSTEGPTTESSSTTEILSTEMTTESSSTIDLTTESDAEMDNFVCEYDNFHLECGVGQTIHVLSALYGRQNSDVCAKRPGHADCAADNSLTVVQQECEGFRTCDILAHDDVFGDPCPGKSKYLEIEYSCEDFCGPDQSPCSDDGPCIPNHRFCDDVVDCTETLYDEKDCPCPSDGDVRCANMRCIDSDLICNGVDDCRDGDNSDEADCVIVTTKESTTTGPCIEGDFACSPEGPCIDEWRVCDGLPDCIETEKDEMNCPCRNEGHFRCANRRCIPPVLKCNGRDDCRDNSDEADCP